MEYEILLQQLENVKVPFGINAGVPLLQLSNDSLQAYAENAEVKEHYPRSHMLAEELLKHRGAALAKRDAERGPEESALLEAKAKEEAEAAELARLEAEEAKAKEEAEAKELEGDHHKKSKKGH